MTSRMRRPTPESMSKRWWRAKLVALALVALPVTGWAQTQLSCSLTDVKVEQLSNAVEVRLQSDGLLNIEMDRADIIDPEDGWSRVWRKDIPVRITNGRSVVGTFVDISTYPVNYVELLTPPGSREGVGLDVRVVLYENAGFRNIDVDNLDEERYYNGRTVAFDVAKSPSRRELVITVWSDRHEIVGGDEKPRPELDLRAELSVAATGDLVDVDALNTPLTELMDEVSRATGVPILVDDSMKRLATVRLHRVTLAYLMAALANGYGLTALETDGVWALSDGLPSGIAPYVSGETRVISVHNMSALGAIDMLPNFLLRYLRPNTSGDAIIAHGPPQLLDRIEEDLRQLDRPSQMVRVRTAVVEVLDSTASERTWRFLRGGRTQVSWDAEQGFVRFRHGDRSLDRYITSLNALKTRGKVRVNVQPEMIVRPGSQGKVFVGERQYYQFVQQGGDVRLSSAEAGVGMTCRPRPTGSGLIENRVTVEVSTLRRLTGGNPVIDRRRARGTMLVQSGDTMVMGGGLTVAQDDRDRSAPKAAYAFGPARYLAQSERAENEMREIIFLMSAEIVDDSSPAAAVATGARMEG